MLLHGYLFFTFIELHNLVIDVALLLSVRNLWQSKRYLPEPLS